jgi:hypothetical protein
LGDDDKGQVQIKHNGITWKEYFAFESIEELNEIIKNYLEEESK